MCMLCVIPPQVIPSRDKLENSALNNPHGFGFAIVVPSENRIIVERTMNADESINRFLELRGKYPEGYATWHARLATHGSKTVDNCHPFKVGNDMTYLAHNGILSVLEDNTDRSDTRIFAEDLLPAIGGVSALDNEQVYNMIEDFTTGSKVVVLTVDPAAKHQAYLFHEEKGNVDEAGVWWSNDSCKLNYGYSSTKWVSDKDYDLFKSPNVTDQYIMFECPNCQGMLDESWVEDDGACYFCRSCLDCGSEYNNCLCYTSSNYKSKPVKENWWTTEAKQESALYAGWGRLDY